MRRFPPIFVLTVLLASPAASLAKTPGPSRPNPAGDGTLSIMRARGEFIVNLKGAVIGKVGVGRIQVTDKNPGDAVMPDIRGNVRPRVISPTTTVYIGTQIRFRVLDGAYKLKIDGSDIQLSAVGRGWATLDGDPNFVKNGFYSVNGGPYQPIPQDRTRVPIILPYGP